MGDKEGLIAPSNAPLHRATIGVCLAFYVRFPRNDVIIVFKGRGPLLGITTGGTYTISANRSCQQGRGVRWGEVAIARLIMGVLPASWSKHIDTREALLAFPVGTIPESNDRHFVCLVVDTPSPSPKDDQLNKTKPPCVTNP